MLHVVYKRGSYPVHGESTALLERDVPTTTDDLKELEKALEERTNEDVTILWWRAMKEASMNKIPD